jgi:hypothetical protein
MTSTLTRRLREALLLGIVLLTAAGFAAGCTQAGNVRARLSPSAGTATSPGRSASLTPTSPTVTATPTVQPSVTATTAQPSVTATTPAPTPSAVTAAPTGAAPAPAVSGSPAASNGAASLLWLWVLIAVIAVLGLIALVSQAARRRAARIRTWRAMAADAFAKGAALHDAVSVAGLPGAYGSENAGGRWADIQRRADDLTQTLYRLREAAPGEDERARVEDVLAALYALRSATQTGDMSPAGGPGAGHIQARLRNFEAALQALREPEQGR